MYEYSALAKSTTIWIKQYRWSPPCPAPSCGFSHTCYFYHCYSLSWSLLLTYTVLLNCVFPSHFHQFPYKHYMLSRSHPSHPYIYNLMLVYAIWCCFVNTSLSEINRHTMINVFSQMTYLFALLLPKIPTLDYVHATLPSSTVKRYHSTNHLFLQKTSPQHYCPSTKVTYDLDWAPFSEPDAWLGFYQWWSLQNMIFENSSVFNPTFFVKRTPISLNWDV